MERKTPEHWQRVRTVLDRVLDAPPEARATLLDQLCGGDADLRLEVEALITAEGGAGALLDAPVGEYADALVGELARVGLAPESLAGRRVGVYRLVRELARGGMGTVYLAERADGEFEQQVAVKLLRRGLDTDDVLRRFLAERQILASLSHPNIARLVDGGATDQGRPYLVMEYVEGQPIDRYCDAHRLTVDERLGLFLTVAGAVQHAHRNLVVHRDLKPSNILVSDAGEVKLLDFGIAKLLQPGGAVTAAVTRTGARLLTPEYASPEQVKGEPITTASDVYQLGLLLYELLTGVPAHRTDRRGGAGLERVVCEQMPPLPSLAAREGPAVDERAQARRTTGAELGRRVRGDLDAIVLKALRKEPERRYATAARLADEIERYLSGQPVDARPDSWGYRSGKFVRRHRVGVATATGVVLLLAGLTGLYTERLARERDAAEQSARIAHVESERTAGALAETEQALARAEGLREFLLGLFRAAQPDRPRGQLPDTEALLELGARRALDEHSAPAAERLGMLLTIGKVYLEQSRFEQARPLLDAAVALAREHRAERPDDLARALVDRANFVWQGVGSLDEAEDLLLEAESVAEESGGPWELFANVRGDRAWVTYLMGDRENSLGLLEPLYAQLRQRTDVSASTRFKVVSRLASAHRSLGNLETAAELHGESVELAERLFGAESLMYAIELANSANAERDVGRFGVSESRNRQAIGLYDRIYEDTPMVFRAVARRNLVRTLMALGRFDDALDELAASTAEYSRATGVAEAHDPAAYFYRGKMLAIMHRWGDAERELTRARGLYAAAAEPSVRSLVNVEALLAWTHCRRDNLEAGESLVAILDGRLLGSLPDDTRERAHIHDARAACHLRAGQLEPALHEIDLALQTVQQPGRVMDRADRLIQRARILAAAGRMVEAERDLARAESLYRDRGVADHPSFANIDRARREL
jgi:eukaryotic-like serine/threonine-protein kinase